MTLDGLDSGKSYSIQLMSGETRSIGNGIDYIGTVTVDTPGDTDSTAFAEEIEADGFAENAGEAVERIKQLLE